jgi:peptidyl-prolyl cis-trans isomerase C
MTFDRFLRSSCAVSAAGAIAFMVACGSKGTSTTSSTAKPEGKVIAKVGTGAITEEELKQKLSEQPPFARPRLQTPQGKKEFVENLAKFEILSQEAVKQGIDKSPEAQATIKRVLVQELVKKFYEQKIEPSEEELKGYYEKHQAEFVKPERRRLQHIFIAAPEGSPTEVQEARKKAKATAQALLTKIQAADTRVAAAGSGEVTPLKVMGDLAKTNSSDATSKDVDGDLRFQSKDDLGRTYTYQFATAAYQLTPAKRLSEVIETPKGFHIARLLAVQPAVTQELSDPTVHTTVRDRYVQETRGKRFEEYYEGLKKQAKIEIDEKALEAIEIPAPKNGMPGGMMPMGAPRGLTAPGGHAPAATAPKAPGGH